MNLYPVQYLCDPTPVGILNNNPGNIYNAPGVKFANEITEPGAQWKKFPSMPWGYRALMKNLQAYMNSGTNTLPSITAKWAPAGHGNNNPVKYAYDIEQMTGISRNQVLQSNDVDSLKKIAYAISYIEQGVQPSWHEVNAGAGLLDATGFSDTPQTKDNQLTKILLLGAIALTVGLVVHTQMEKNKRSKRKRLK